jgi:hypothetical protein
MSYCGKCGQPKNPNGVCYNCARIENDARRYGRGDPGMGDRRDHWDWVPRSRRRSWRSSATSTRTRATDLKLSKAAVEVLPPPADFRLIKYSEHLHRGVNQFLADVYEEKRLLSEILLNAELSQAEIVRLRQRHLTTYLPKLVHAWCYEWRKVLSEPDIGVVVRYYGLDGKLRSLTGMLHEIASSSSAAVKMQRSALKCLQQPEQIRQLEGVAAREARHILARSEPGGGERKR